MGFNEWMYGLLFGDAGEALKGKSDEFTAQVDPLKPLVEKPGFNSVFINGKYQYVPKTTQPVQPGLPNQNEQMNMMVEALKFWKPLPK
jgi:hypothetical protein